MSRLTMAAFLLLASARSYAQTWDETTNGGGDAQNLMPGQAVSGIGPLTTITGHLSGFAVNDPYYPYYDFVDLYQIQITDAATFSATTVAPSGSGVLADTQLWLFDAAGNGISYNNNDPSGGTAKSRLTNVNVPSNGVYFLGVSNASSNAETGALQLIWNYDANVPGSEWAPNGPGAPGPLGWWTNLDGGGIGRYRVDLTGASLLDTPPPCVPCDLNCDGSVNPFDINGFLAVLNGGTGCSECAGDANQDGSVNPFDINAFLACLAG